MSAFNASSKKSDAVNEEIIWSNIGSSWCMLVSKCKFLASNVDRSLVIHHDGNIFVLLRQHLGNTYYPAAPGCCHCDLLNLRKTSSCENGCLDGSPKSDGSSGLIDLFGFSLEKIPGSWTALSGFESILPPRRLRRRFVYQCHYRANLLQQGPWSSGSSPCSTPGRVPFDKELR